MENGDQYAKEFGGETGDDPDWFLLSIWGYRDGQKKDSVNFYLADYRFEDNSKDYIVKSWKWVDLSPLGKVDSLAFGLSSSDTGQWGMNTPAYFCMDNLHIKDKAPVAINPVEDIQAKVTREDSTISLSDRYTDPDDEDNFSWEISVNSDSSVAIASIEGENLSISFKGEGQSNVVVKATNAGRSVKDTVIVGVLPQIEGEHTLSDFENLDLEKNSYWNGSDGSGGFESGLAWLPNDYNPDNGNWSGWAYSNMADDTTAGDSNQYSAITAAGIDTGTGSKIYGVSYAAENPVIKLADSSSHQVKGMYITNSTYTALSMKYGNQFAKKFGGKTGNDPDWFKLSIWGKLNGNETDTIDFYLADFRFDDNSKDYIIQTWQWVELSSLGKVDSLMFALSSSDTGQWGMNTPAYFCMDNLRIVDEDPFVANPVADVSVYENAEDTIIDLSGVFSDPDNGDSTITKSVKSNSNIDLVEATISGNELTLSYTENATGEAEIVIQGQSGMKTVLDTFMVKVSEEVTGIDNTQPLRINVYPNPTNGRFKIDTKKGEKLSVRVYDLGGSVVYEEDHYTPAQSVDISDQPAGSYIIKVQKKNKTTNKLIIKR
jgi:hypothetical protein